MVYQPTTKGNFLLILISLLSVYIIWGSTYLAIRIAVTTMPPLCMAGLRFVFAGGIMYFILRLYGDSRPSASQWYGSAIVGAFLMVGGTGFVGCAEKWVGSGLAAIAVTSVPLWACFFSGIFGKWPNRYEIIGLAIGFVGIIMFNMDREIQANFLGAILLFVAPLSWAFGSVLSKKVPSPAGLMASALQMITGGVIAVILGIIIGERMSVFPSPQSLLAFVYLIIFGSMIAFSAYMYLFRYVRPALATSYAFVNPIVAVFLGVFLAGERINREGIIALVVVLIGVVFVVIGNNKEKLLVDNP
ncbi:MAG: drug/metabolite exporter YedA [Candidatus Margulisbacteria bacterium GWF2_38_17]|nr:MAG: drug/metabolite exporter YedA [Candidatus Margulisbacteria bacterium GWF2_38_17]